MKARILVIDDEAEIRRSVRMILEYEGYDVLEASTGPEGVALAEKESPDLVFLDVKMPGMDGLEALQRIRAASETLPVVIISGHGTVSTAVEATKAGAFDFIEKPLASERVLLTIRNALDQTRLADENRSLKRAAEVRHQMVGESPALRHVWDAIKRAAPTNATVLLLGESGAGKELVARSIHRNSLRTRERFVQVNCAAIPEELIESELFGHEKGSFTGAHAQKKGQFEIADRGTLFLDEIGDLSVAMQAKLLRALQEKEIMRVGATRTIKVDVRVIGATNRDLEAMVKDNRFREDLYYRLNIIPITIPPLRNRRDDIKQLVDFFVAKHSVGSQRKIRGVTASARNLIMNYSWPGNVRQLESAIERAILLAEGDEIEVEDLPLEIRQEGTPAAAFNFKLPPEGISFEELERSLITQAMEQTGWNITRAAKLLGLSFRTLQYRLEKFNMKKPGKD